MALVLAGCSAKPQPQAPVHQHVSTLVITKDDATTVAELVAQADKEFDAARYEEAALLFARVVAVDVSARERGRALVGLGASLDLAGHPAEAFDAYKRALDGETNNFRGPGSTERVFSRAALTAWLLRLHFFLEHNSDEEGAWLERLVKNLGRARPAALDELAIVAFLAERSLARDDASGLKQQLGRGEVLAESLSLSFQTRLPLEAVPFFLIKGDALRKAAARITFDPFPAEFPAALEERCALLLMAQSAYSEAMRANSAEYSARAGERIADLYQALHQDLVNMESPPTANTQERRELLDAATRLRYSILLVKAEKMVTHTLLMIERTGIHGPTEERLQKLRDRLHSAKSAEEAALARLPYSREDLLKVLDDMKTDAATRAR
jgi:tetratricopeptide (TPR) repeat protein